MIGTRKFVILAFTQAGGTGRDVQDRAQFDFRKTCSGNDLVRDSESAGTDDRGYGQGNHGWPHLTQMVSTRVWSWPHQFGTRRPLDVAYWNPFEGSLKHRSLAASESSGRQVSLCGRFWIR